MRVSSFVLPLFGLGAMLVACGSSKSNPSLFGTPSTVAGHPSGDAGAPTGGDIGDDDSDDGGVGTGGKPGGIIVGGDDGGGSTPGNCNSGGADVDSDGDGWTPNQGDCNDCDPSVNPGALDVPNYTKDDQGMPTTTPADPQIDEDCDGTTFNPGDTAASCDDNLSPDYSANDPMNAAKAMGLCNVNVPEDPADPTQRKWGVLAASFSTISGGFLNSPLDTGSVEEGLGILPKFGDYTNPQEGNSIFCLSSGIARAPGQTGYTKSQGVEHPGGGLLGHEDNPPPGFPKVGTCGGGDTTSELFDGVALDLKIRVPTNAKSMSFKFRFFSHEYGVYTCEEFNDTFAVLMAPSPFASKNSMTDDQNASADIAFEATGDANVPYNVIGVNNESFFTACNSSDAEKGNYPNCKGTQELKNTGFDNNGGSAWLQSTVPIDPKANGGIIFLRFAIWDASDNIVDSTTVVDDIEFSGDEGTTVKTVVVPQPH